MAWPFQWQELDILANKLIVIAIAAVCMCFYSDKMEVVASLLYTPEQLALRNDSPGQQGLKYTLPNSNSYSELN